MARWAIAIASVLWVPALAHAQDGKARTEADAEQVDGGSADASSDDTGWTGFPVVAYAPETGVVLAGYLLRSFRMPDSADDTRTSSVRASAGYTTRGQLGVELLPEIYLNDEELFLAADLTFRDYPNDFFGIGNDTREEDEEPYDLRMFGVELEISGRVAPQTYVGFLQQAERTWVSDIQPGGLLATQDITGADGGWLVGYGLVGRYDDRDSTFDARRGGFYELRLLRYDELFGGDFDATRVDVDLRHYFTLFETHGLALQGLAQLASGGLPFTALPELGGANLLRGLYGGRYRDENLLALQAEYRFPIHWRFGGVVFAGVGEVAESVGDFRLGGVHPAGGGGLRFSIDRDERVNARVDVGASAGAAAVYVSVGEAF